MAVVGLETSIHVLMSWLWPELSSAGKHLSISPAEAAPQRDTHVLIGAQVGVQFSLQLHECPNTEL